MTAACCAKRAWSLLLWAMLGFPAPSSRVCGAQGLPILRQGHPSPRGGGEEEEQEGEVEPDHDAVEVAGAGWVGAEAVEVGHPAGDAAVEPVVGEVDEGADEVAHPLEQAAVAGGARG